VLQKTDDITKEKELLMAVMLATDEVETLS